MRKFLITNHTFSGEAVLIFNADGLLVIIDISNTDMKDVFANWIYRNVPVHIDQFFEFMKGRQGVKCVEASIDITFEMFWDKYGKKINKKRCEQIWSRMSKAKQVAAFYGIDKYDRYLVQLKWDRTKADPETYLRKEMWDSEWK